MSPHRPLTTALVLLAVAVLGTGCYTVLRHPEAEPWSSSGAPDRDYRGTDPDFLYRWTDPYYTSLYGGFPAAWGYYYYHPWTPTGPWWCDPWYPWHPWGPDTDGPAAVSGGRHAWDRGPGSPPSGSHSPGVGGTSPSPGVGVGRPATPAAPANPAPDTTRSRPERRPEPTRTEENPRRNAWGR